MTAFLDGNEISSVEFTPDLTAGELIDRIQKKLHETGEMIFAVACDHEEVPPNGLDQVLALPVMKIGRLDLVTGRPELVVLEALEETRVALEDTLLLVRQTSEALISGNTEEGMLGLVGCVDAWANVHEAVTQGGALIKIDFDQVVVESRNIRGCLQDIQSKLLEIKDAAESGNHYLLGEILRYETSEMLRSWETMLDLVINQVRILAGKAMVIPSRPPVSTS